METERQKQLGAYYTPHDVARSLVHWAVSSRDDRLLDPSCGDGRFLVTHPNSVGVEGDPLAAAIVHARAPGCLIHQGDFFSWASSTLERFECAAGNPPFIRYQRFSGTVREAALSLCAKLGANFNALSSSWAPFLVATASLLKPGGRLAFVVPAEIGHAPYAIPLLIYLLEHFSHVRIIAVKEKLFPELSEDCWLLFCDGYGGRTDFFLLSDIDRFASSMRPPRSGRRISATEWRMSGRRLRQFLLPGSTIELYRSLADSPATVRLSEVARVGIGYVTGANDFFHLRPSAARSWRIPENFLLPAVRNGRDLAGRSISHATVERWRKNDEPKFLLRLERSGQIPSAVSRYLDSPDGQQARAAYKCRNRTPWYVVPDIHVPDGFLSYMSGETPSLVANRAQCVGTNSVHVVRMKPGFTIGALQQRWNDPLTQLSCEIEGHPLGGGMLKLEPGEANRVLIRRQAACDPQQQDALREAVAAMRQWRHYA
ncbi:MAG TPA: N-6 DNA methylase [Pirellulales bacterium]|nr:N-6 DNA methylase [Pirellulales bacterium]